MLSSLSFQREGNSNIYRLYDSPQEHMHTLPDTHEPLLICAPMYICNLHTLLDSTADETHVHNFEFTYIHVSQDRCIKIG